MKRALANLIVFFYIYSMAFSFLPLRITTGSFYALLGILIFLIRVFRSKYLFINKQYLSFILFTFSMLCISFSSNLLNNTNDFAITRYSISLISTFFSSFFVVVVLKKLFVKTSFETTCNLMINAIFIQAIIAFLMFSVPWIGDMFNRIELVDTNDLSIINAVKEFRITGFGTRFFGSGVISGLGLILISYIIKTQDIDSRHIIILTFKYLIILVVGMMMARTTLVGAFISLMLIIIPKNSKLRKTNAKRLFLFLTSIILIILTCYIIIINMPKLRENLESVFNFAFELFINFFEKNSLESESTNELKEMYRFPSELKTWIIGDGYWSNPVSDGYYMSTDVGYLRMIYFFGLVGTSVFFITNYFSMVFDKKLKNRRLIMTTLFSYLLVLNFKGHVDIITFTLLLSMSSVICFRNNKEIQ